MERGPDLVQNPEKSNVYLTYTTGIKTNKQTSNNINAYYAFYVYQKFSNFMEWSRMEQIIEGGQIWQMQVGGGVKFRTQNHLPSPPPSNDFWMVCNC